MAAGSCPPAAPGYGRNTEFPAPPAQIPAARRHCGPARRSRGWPEHACAADGAVCTPGGACPVDRAAHIVPGPGPEIQTQEEGLTAHFENLPAEHDGTNAFEFRIAFGEAIKIGFLTFQDHSLSVIWHGDEGEAGEQVARSTGSEGRPVLERGGDRLAAGELVSGRKPPTPARNLRRTATLPARFQPRNRPHRHH